MNSVFDSLISQIITINFPVLISGGSNNLLTASKKTKIDITTRNKPLIKPELISKQIVSFIFKNK